MTSCVWQVKENCVLMCSGVSFELVITQHFTFVLAHVSRKPTLLLCVSPLLSHNYHTDTSDAISVSVGFPTPSSSP